MNSKLRWFTLMEKEIVFGSISYIFFILGFSIENVPVIATNELKFCSLMFIILSSIFFNKTIY